MKNVMTVRVVVDGALRLDAGDGNALRTGPGRADRKGSGQGHAQSRHHDEPR